MKNESDDELVETLRMENSAEFFQPVLEHIEKVGGEAAFALTAKKMRERAVPVHSQEPSAKIEFVMERHRPVLGENHEPGKCMNAMVVSRLRYRFDPVEDEIQELERIGDAKLEVDTDWLAEAQCAEFFISAEMLQAGKYLVEEMVTGDQEIVRDKSEAEAFAKRVSEGLELSG